MYATKKLVIFSLVIAVCFSAFGMEDFKKKLRNNFSTIVLSPRQAIAAAITLPIIIAGGTMLCNSDSLPSMPELSPKFLGAGATVATVPAFYLLANRFTPEEQAKQCEVAIAKIKDNKIIKDVTAINKILNMFRLEGKKAGEVLLQEFLNEKFSAKVDQKHFPSLIAINKLCKLEREIVNIEKRLEIINKGPFPFENEKKMVEQLRGKILALDDHVEKIKIVHQVKAVNLKEALANFSAKIAAFVPMLTQPVATGLMVLLQSLLTKIGSPYRVI
jgi:hypothetical protein